MSEGQQETGLNDEASDSKSNKKSVIVSLLTKSTIVSSLISSIIGGGIVAIAGIWGGYLSLEGVRDAALSAEKATRYAAELAANTSVENTSAQIEAARELENTKLLVSCLSGQVSETPWSMMRKEANSAFDPKKAEAFAKEVLGPKKPANYFTWTWNNGDSIKMHLSEGDQALNIPFHDDIHYTAADIKRFSSSHPYYSALSIQREHVPWIVQDPLKDWNAVRIKFCTNVLQKGYSEATAQENQD